MANTTQTPNQVATPYAGVIPQTKALGMIVARWAKPQARIEQAVANAPNIIKLNVGGKIFETSKDTLLRVEGSYFHAWLGFGNWKPDDTTNAYFLDLDPTLFRHVLFYLRTGTRMQEDGLTTAEKEELKAMMKYLRVCPWGTWGQVIRWNYRSKAPYVTVTNCDRTVEKSTYKGWGGAIATEALEGTMYVCIDVCSIDIFVGLCPLAGFDCNSWDNSSEHCYGYSSNGFVHKKSQAEPQAKLQVGSTVKIQRCATNVVFTVTNRAPIHVPLVDPYEELLPVVFMYSVGAKVTMSR